MALWPALDCKGILVCWFVCWNLSIAGRKFFRKLLFLKKMEVYKWTCDEDAEKASRPHEFPTWLCPHLQLTCNLQHGLKKPSWKGLDLASQVPQLTPSLASLPSQYLVSTPKHLKVWRPWSESGGPEGSTNFHRSITRYDWRLEEAAAPNDKRMKLVLLHLLLPSCLPRIFLPTNMTRATTKSHQNDSTTKDPPLRK